MSVLVGEAEVGVSTGRRQGVPELRDCGAGVEVDLVRVLPVVPVAIRAQARGAGGGIAEVAVGYPGRERVEASVELTTGLGGVVGGDHHERLVQDAADLQRVDQLPDLRVGRLGDERQVAHFLVRAGRAGLLVFRAPHVAQLVDPAEAHEHAAPGPVVLDHPNGSVGGPDVAAKVRRIASGYEAVALERIDPRRQDRARAIRVRALPRPPAVAPRGQVEVGRRRQVGVLGHSPSRDAVALDRRGVAADLQDYVLGVGGGAVASERACVAGRADGRALLRDRDELRRLAEAVVEVVRKLPVAAVLDQRLELRARHARGHVVVAAARRARRRRRGRPRSTSPCASGTGRS